MLHFDSSYPRRSPTDADLLSKVGYVQLQLGDLGGAQQTFSKVDALLSGTMDEKLLNMAGRNRGLLHFAEKQYTKAFDEFTAVLGRSPYDTVSANNKVSCSYICLPCVKNVALSNRSYKHIVLLLVARGVNFFHDSNL